MLSLSAFVYVGTFGIFWVDAVVASLIGFFMIGIVPICFNFGGELVYPESEATGSALLTCSADLIGSNTKAITESEIDPPVVIFPSG